MKKRTEWIYGDPSVRVPLILLRSAAWRGLGYSAGVLYLFMRASIKDENNGFKNPTEDEVKFGPSDALKYGMNKRTYYRALNDLIDRGIIERVENGFGGKKATFDMLSLDWVEE